MERMMEGIPIERVIKKLQAEGIEVTREEAEEIAQFLLKLTKLILHDYFETT